MSEPLEESPQGQVMFCLDCMYKHARDLEHHMEDASRVDKTARKFWNQNIDSVRGLRKYLLERMKGKPHKECETCENKSRSSNPEKRLYEPYGLTAKERRSKMRVRGKCTPKSQALYCRLVRCIRKVEPREDNVKSAVAVCRAKVK